MLGLNDTVIIKTPVHTSDGRGGVSTTYSVKIPALVSSIQPIRREELRMEVQGQTVTEPYLLSYETITSGPVVSEGDIVDHQNRLFLVLVVGSISGLGTHCEAIIKRVSGDAAVA